MKTMTDHLTEGTGHVYDQALRYGVRCAIEGDTYGTLKSARESIAKHRAEYGFARVWAPILTAPDENMKLAKGATPAYGITLQHYVVKTKHQGTLNLCPNAGDCTKVCVLDNGSGAYPTVQRARRWKTELLANHPWAFFVHLGWEIQRALMRESKRMNEYMAVRKRAHWLDSNRFEPYIMLRPNVNSDIEWERICPALVDGSVFGDRVWFYGYTKLTSVLATNGWVTPYYRVAYSMNERTHYETGGINPDVFDFLWRGGSVAIVTDRKKGEGKLGTARPKNAHPSKTFTLDADATDEWLFYPNVIGDLSAKGKARKLIGKSEFVRPSIATATPVSIR